MLSKVFSYHYNNAYYFMSVSVGFQRIIAFYFNRSGGTKLPR